MKKSLILGIAMILASTANASLYPYVYAVDFLPYGTQYQIVPRVKLIDIGALGDQVLIGKYSGYLSKGVGETGKPIINTVSICSAGRVFTNPTLSELGLYSYNSCKGRNYLPVAKPGGIRCLGYVILQGVGTRPHEFLTPPGGCFELPDYQQWCSMTTPELNINHGVITVKEAYSHRASKTVNINCTNAFKAKLSLVTGLDTIPLGGGSSKISTSLGPLGKAFSLNKGDNTVEIISELRNVKIGSWSASAVLVLEPQ